MSNTPRTEASKMNATHLSPSDDSVPTDFAAGLEAELIRAEAVIDAARTIRSLATSVASHKLNSFKIDLDYVALLLGTAIDAYDKHNGGCHD